MNENPIRELLIFFGYMFSMAGGLVFGTFTAVTAGAPNGLASIIGIVFAFAALIAFGAILKPTDRG